MPITMVDSIGVDWALAFSLIDPATTERGSIEPTQAYKHNKYKVLACYCPTHLEYEDKFWIDWAGKIFGEVKDYKWLSPEHDLHETIGYSVSLLAIW